MANVFEIRNLAFAYPKQTEPTIKNISFSIKKGTIFGLLGPSGAGKSTTQKILTKLLTGYSGEILYLGKDLKAYGKPFYEDIGVGFEMPVHFNKLTAMENLAYFAGLYRRKIDYEALLTKVGLFEARNQAVGEYSKGMKVRLNFVRAMLNDPEVLFLDEPTNGLDPKNSKIVKDLILDFKRQGKTVLITTHLMGDVEQLCDEVVFMTNGRLSEIASVREWKLKYGKKEVAVEYQNGEGLVKTVFPMEGLGENPAFLDCMKHPIETIHSGETSLEDIFIRVTGEKEMNLFGILYAGEIKRLFRYKILFFSFLVSAIWVGILALSDAATAEGLAPTLIVTDAGMMSIVLLGASFFFEKQEETLKTLLVSPAPVWMILLAKVASAMTAGLVSMILVAGSAWLIHGIAVNLLLMGLYVLAIVAGNTAIGYVMILVSKDFIAMLVKFAGLMIAFYVPSLLVPLGIIPAEWDFVGLLSPVYAGSLLIESLYRTVETWKILVAFAYLGAIALTLYPLFVYRRFQKVAIGG